MVNRVSQIPVSYPTDDGDRARLFEAKPGMKEILAAFPQISGVDLIPLFILAMNAAYLETVEGLAATELGKVRSECALFELDAGLDLYRALNTEKHLDAGQRAIVAAWIGWESVDGVIRRTK